MDIPNENRAGPSQTTPSTPHELLRGEKWQRLLETETQIDSLELHHQQVRSEIEKLNGTGLLNLLYSVAGNKQERLESARQEDEALQEQLNKLRNELEGLHRELASVKPRGDQPEPGSR